MFWMYQSGAGPRNGPHYSALIPAAKDAGVTVVTGIRRSRPFAPTSSAACSVSAAALIHIRSADRSIVTSMSSHALMSWALRWISMTQVFALALVLLSLVVSRRRHSDPQGQLGALNVVGWWCGGYHRHPHSAHDPGVRGSQQCRVSAMASRCSTGLSSNTTEPGESTAQQPQATKRETACYRSTPQTTSGRLASHAQP